MKKLAVLVILLAALAGIGLVVSAEGSAVISCDTDTDCMEKNGGGGPEPVMRPSHHIYKAP